MTNTPNPNTMSVQVVNYFYNGSPIPFMINGKVMINATKMAKPFGKNPKDWLKLQSTQEFLQELTKRRKILLTDLVQVKYGGKDPGTWMHEDVALEFARWLSPAFAIWCNDKIKEILLRNANGRANQSDEKPTGQYIWVTGADGNLYLLSILKAMREFINEEISGSICNELRLINKLEAACTLFPEDRRKINKMNVKVV